MSQATGPSRLPAESSASVVFVVVIYNISIEQSPTLESLMPSLAKVGGFTHRVLVFDNTEGPSSNAPENFPGGRFVAYGVNHGLAKAYNDALAYCVDHGARVLVTLDQDSVVTREYLEALSEALPGLRDKVVALCPEIVSHGRTISPFRVNWWGRRSFGHAPDVSGAINSFSAYSVEYLSSVGGFDAFYWLDSLDMVTYARIRRSGKSMAPLNARVGHDLALLAGRLSRRRLVNIAYYEASYLLEYGGAVQALVGLGRLLARAFRVAPSGGRIGYVMAGMVAASRGALAGARRRVVRPG